MFSFRSFLCMLDTFLTHQNGNDYQGISFSLLKKKFVMPLTKITKSIKNRRKNSFRREIETRLFSLLKTAFRKGILQQKRLVGEMFRNAEIKEHVQTPTKGDRVEKERQDQTKLFKV